MNSVRFVWETVVRCVHAQRELACTANISIACEPILLKFNILLSNNQLNTVRSIWETLVTWVHTHRELACTANIFIALEQILLKFLLTCSCWHLRYVISTLNKLVVLLQILNTAHVSLRERCTGEEWNFPSLGYRDLWSNSGKSLKFLKPEESLVTC